MLAEPSPQPPIEQSDDLIAVDRVTQGIRRVIEKVASSEVAVLILGERGTPRERLAQALHARSGRPRERFVTVHCPAIPGAERNVGSASGPGTHSMDVPESIAGRIAAASGGTLFLDEVDALPAVLQLSLLGGLRQSLAADVRVVASAGPALDTLVQQQGFLHDLRDRLAEVVLHVPPLRERSGDILAIAQAALVRYAGAKGGPRRGFSEDALLLLTSHNWPGNERELENKVRIACLLSDAPLVTAADLDLAGGGAVNLPLNLKEVRNRAERDAVSRAMAAAMGNVSRAAELLGVSRPTLYGLLARHEMDVDALRQRDIADRFEFRSVSRHTG